MAELVAKRYGKALYELAVESETIDALQAELDVLIQSFSEESEFQTVLDHPKLGQGKKIELMESMFKGKISEDVMGLMVVAIKKGRQDHLIEIFQDALARIHEHKGLITAYVTSARALDDQEVEAIKKKLQGQTGKTITLDCQVDASFIGGMTIRIEDRIVDHTIKGSLHRLSRQLVDMQITSEQ